MPLGGSVLHEAFFFFLTQNYHWVGVVAHTFSSNTQEAEATDF